MNETMIKTFETMNIFEMFNQYKAVGPTKLSDMDNFIKMCRNDGYPAIAEFFEEWLVYMRCYIDREHDADD